VAREYAPIRLSIWADDDFRGLSPEAQHLYFVLVTSPTLNHCGVADWRPKRIAALSRGWTVETVDRAAWELVEGLYIVVDEDTEEVLVRSFVRHDGLMKQPNMAVAMHSAHMALASSVLRGVLVHEVKRLAKDQPELKSWGAAASKDLLSEMVSREGIDPSTYPLGNPSRKGSINPSTKGSGMDGAKGSGNPSGNPSPTPRPTPTPASSNLLAPTEQAPPRRRAPTNTETPEARIANLVHEHTGSATPWAATMETAKRALRVKGASESAVGEIMCALYDAGKPLTTTLIGQVLSGAVTLGGSPGSGPAATPPSKTDAAIRDIAARAARRSDPQLTIGVSA